MKKCRACKEPFEPQYNSTQVVCSPKCGIELAKHKHAAKEKKAKAITRKEWNKAKKNHKLSDRPLQTKLCQDAVNWYVKYVQEADKPCYTCDKPLNASTAIHCGHWLTIGAHPDKRFMHLWLRRQCFSCNCKNSGRPDVFEKRLRAEKGDKAVDEFVASKPPKLTTPEIVELKKHFLKLNREAKKLMEAA